MNTGQQYFTLLYVLLILLCASPVGAGEQAPTLLPAGIVMQESFKPGFGAAIGSVRAKTGLVALLHAQDTAGYWAESNLPVFMRDTIVTPSDGRAMLVFADESTVSVSADTKLTINRAIFDPDKKERSSFLGMSVGRARFWVKKLPGFKRSEFKVKTKTLVAGVRGSDFVITVFPNRTEVAALDKTELELVRLADPDKLIVLQSFERIRMVKGEPPSVIEKISPTEADQLKKELPMSLHPKETGGTPIKEAGAKKAPGATGRTPAKDGTAPLLSVQKDKTVLVPVTDLVEPVAPIGLDGFTQPLVPEFIEQAEMTAVEQEATTQQETIVQEVVEDTIDEEIGPLPGLPGAPQ